MEAILVTAMAASLIALAPLYIIVRVFNGKGVANKYFSEMMLAGPMGAMIGGIYFFLFEYISVLLLEAILLPLNLNLYVDIVNILDHQLYQGLLLGVCCAIGGATVMKDT